jgi:hypothetical protein
MENKIKIMVASTIYNFEDNISTICSELSTMGYHVLNSHIGSIKVNPYESNLENCLNAVRECDVFLGIIRPYYGTGNIDELNITFEEIKLAMKLNKPYWFLVHRDVVFARQLMKHLCFVDTLGNEYKNISVKPNKNFDVRTLDIYNHVIKEGTPIATRTGNWAQEFYRLDEALVYIKAQYEDKDFILGVLNSNNRNNGTNNY